MSAPSATSLVTDRLSLPFPVRTVATIIPGFTISFLLTVSPATQKHSLIFRAENAHRFPSTKAGWYLYHRSKSYAALVGGVLDSFKVGLKTGGVAGAFVVIEESVDRVRNRRDAGSSVVAALATAGGWSLWCKYLNMDRVAD
jgi:hypothetical protein